MSERDTDLLDPVLVKSLTGSFTGSSFQKLKESWYQKDGEDDVWDQREEDFLEQQSEVKTVVAGRDRCNNRAKDSLVLERTRKGHGCCSDCWDGSGCWQPP